tara:strand:- start:83 stop:1258 length:1176 start_codon:yes stop_codon:yes gene_type:complete
VEVYLNFSNKEKMLLGQVPYDAVSEVYLDVDEKKSELCDFMKLIGKRPISIVPSKYKTMCDIIDAQGRDAILTVPKEKLKVYIQECLGDVQNALCDKEDADYLVTYLTIKRCLEGLSRAAIDYQKLAGLISDTKNETITSNLKSFVPEVDSLCKPVTYCMTATNTGRLTVKSGPQILTSPASVRSCLRSRHSEGKILQVDIISAEPKFALHLKGEDIPVDVYTHVAKEILDNSVERHHAKLITLCSLYGQSAKNLEKKLPSNINARSVIRRTRDYFGFDFLKSRLKTELSNDNFRNAVGRPLKINENQDHLLISYYLQSSVAEGSILMFSNFIEKFQKFCDPIFVIHDALLIDCQKDFANVLLEKKNIRLSLGDWKFDAEVKLVSNIYEHE